MIDIAAADISAAYADVLVQLTRARAALTAISVQAMEGETLAALSARRDLVQVLAAINRQARRALR